MRGRHSYAFLKMLGVTETIANNEAEYIDIAVRLSLDQEWRNSIVQRMIHCHSSLYEDKKESIPWLIDQVLLRNKFANPDESTLLEILFLSLHNGCDRVRGTLSRGLNSYCTWILVHFNGLALLAVELIPRRVSGLVQDVSL